MVPQFLIREVNAFKVFQPDARRLIQINLIYALAFPFIIIFGSAFILRATNGDNTLAIIYNWGFFIGLIFGYLSTGLLLKKGMGIKWVFSSGILLSVIPLCILMFFGRDTGYGVIFYGLIVGSGNGIYWSCRNFLTVITTEDKNRNFFASIEQFIIIFCNALIPLLFGYFILGREPDTEYKMTAYKYTSLAILIINVFACYLILKSGFKNPAVNDFLFRKFHKPWNYHRILTFCVGMVESGFMVLMTLLILNVAGDESILGRIEFSAAIFSVFSIYLVGRISKPEHRGWIMFSGALSLIVGGTILVFTIQDKTLIGNLFTVSFLGVIIMKVCQVIADPMIHSSFRATYLSNIEKSSITEKRDIYTYVMDNEYFMNGGRIFGGVVFLLLSNFDSSIGALRFTFIVLALVQLCSAYLVHKMNRKSPAAL